LNRAFIGQAVHQNQSPPSIGVDGAGVGLDPTAAIGNADLHGFLGGVVTHVHGHHGTVGADSVAVSVLGAIGQGLVAGQDNVGGPLGVHFHGVV
jgi:hypothetical protein